MGFGQYSETAGNGAARYHVPANGRQRVVMDSADSVAHLWAAQAQETARFRDNFYFTGRRLYSYGSHYLAGVIMPDGVALLNADSYSVTTSRHMNAARAAVSHKTRYSIPELTELDRVLDSAERAAREIKRGKAEGMDSDSPYLLRAERDRAKAKADALKWARDNLASARVTHEAAAYVLKAFKLRHDTAKLKAEGEAAAAKAKAAEIKRDAAEIKRDAAELARLSDSAFLALYPGDRERYGREAAVNPELDSFAKRLARAHKAATGKRAKAKLWARLKAFRAHAAGVNGRLYAAQLAKRREEYAAWQAGGARPMGGVFGQFSELAAEAEEIRKAERAEYAERSAREYAAWRAGTGKRPPASNYDPETPERAEIERAHAEEQAAAVAAWRSGAGSSAAGYYSDASGGALLRINGETLETSHGASVPLDHAIRAFRFVKLIRERGESWRKNGRQIRVGFYSLDSIDPQGNFRAGCHLINWPEIERAAQEAGVFELPADDSAVESSH